ncbi:MAG: hypothetical protein ACR2K3_02615 [Nocardioides sp.]
MTRLLLILPALALTACGTSTSSAGGAGQPDSPHAPSPKVLAVVSMTGANGQVSVKPQALTPASNLARFTKDFRGEALGNQIRSVLQKQPPPTGMYAAGAVIAVGCDVPPGADVVETGSGYEVVAKEVASPKPECLAPVTSVAVVALPESS